MIHPNALTDRHILRVAEGLTQDMAASLEDCRADTALIAAGALLIAVCMEYGVDAGEVLEQMQDVLDAAEDRQTALSFAH